MIGGSIGPYRIDRELGSGGMGKVYAATVAGRCPGLGEGTGVALKVVHLLVRVREGVVVALRRAGRKRASPRTAGNPGRSPSRGSRLDLRPPPPNLGPAAPVPVRVGNAGAPREDP